MGTYGRQPGSKIRVVVADDSLVARDMLAQLLASDDEIEIAATVANGEEAVEAVERLHPDLITLDIHMPRMDGLEAAERIMAFNPTPILVVSSSVHGEGVGRAFDALAVGALDVVKKPEFADWSTVESVRRDLVSRVKVLARVKAITHLRGRRLHPGAASGPSSRASGVGGCQVIAIGSSTGGPSALLEILGRLPEGFPVPIVIAQHIAEGFVPGLARWLDAGSRIGVVPAVDGGELAPGTAYLAATGCNTEIDGTRTRLVRCRPGQLYVPSADSLFTSVASSHGDRSIGVLLTGMGTDGVSGLKRMFDAGAHTICQDEATSAVWGMPKEAIAIGAAQRVLPVHDIAEVLGRLVLAR